MLDGMERGTPAYARTWFEQAEADLRAAEISLAGGVFEWTCFQSQQAAEKALKAFLHAEGTVAVLTHSVRRLIGECATREAAFEGLDEAARFLDQHYIPTRYPNGLDEEIPPARYYRREDGERCVSSARSILEIARRRFSR